MIKSIRWRPLEKPLIIQQTIYNHKQVVSDNNSEASFLKLSQNASKQIMNFPDLDHFQAIENQIYTLQQKSALKLNQLQQTLVRLEAGKRNKVEVEKQLIEQNKENLCVAYQRVVHPKEDNDNLLQCKFEMDENFNYVKSKEYFQSEPFSTSQVKSKEMLSLKNSRQITFKKSQSDQQPKTKRKPRPRSFSLSCHPQEIDCSVTARKNSVNKHQVDKKQKEPRSSSSDKVAKRGRVYQQILSLYSIPKLLAMELKVK